MVGQIVNYNDLLAQGKELANQVGADKAEAAGDKCFVEFQTIEF